MFWRKRNATVSRINIAWRAGNSFLKSHSFCIIHKKTIFYLVLESGVPIIFETKLSKNGVNKALRVPSMSGRKIWGKGWTKPSRNETSYVRGSSTYEFKCLTFSNIFVNKSLENASLNLVCKLSKYALNKKRPCFKILIVFAIARLP